MSEYNSQIHKTPEQQANEKIRYDQVLAQEKARRLVIANRLQYRENMINKGVPKEWAPAVSDIVNGIAQKDWDTHVDRMNRIIASRPDTGQTTAPVTNDLSGRRSFAGINGVRQTGAGVVATDPDTGRQVAVTPNAEQAMSLKTGGAWDNMSTADRTNYLRGITGQAAPVITPRTPLEGQAAVARYMAPDTAAVTRDVATGNEVGTQPGLGTWNITHPTDVRTAVAPTTNPVATPPVVAPRDLDPFLSQGREVLPAGDLNIGSQLPASPGFTPSAGTKAGLATRAAIGDIFSTGGTPSTPGKVTSLPPAPTTPLIDIPKFASNAVDYTKALFSGNGAGTEAGASRATAAQFESPTLGNPTPTTPTSPVKDIDSAGSSIANFGKNEDDWKDSRYAFSGF